jgi:uncharacterized integral membrane protein
MQKSFWTRPKTILWIIGIILILIFIFQNVEPTQLHFLFWSLPELPKLVFILISMALGALLALLISWEIRHHKNKKD